MILKNRRQHPEMYCICFGGIGDEGDARRDEAKLRFVNKHAKQTNTNPCKDGVAGRVWTLSWRWIKRSAVCCWGTKG